MFSLILLLLYFGDATGQGGMPAPNPPITTTTTTTTPRPPQVPIQETKPMDSTYRNGTYLMDWLFNGCWSDVSGRCNIQESEKSYEYEGYDGFYNNIGRPELGSVDTPLLRRSPAAYKDGSYKPSGFNRPQPLVLSENLLNGTIGTKSKTGKNAFLVFFGQQVVEEILDAQRAACPPEYFNIDIPEGHRYRLIHSKLPLLRTRYDARTGYSPNNPRQQLNEITPYIDGGLVYGTTKAWSDVLRTYKNGSIDPYGKLASSYDGSFPEINQIRLPMANPPPPAHHDLYTKRHELERVDRFFMLGNPRGNENPYLLTFGVLWFRWHNHVATHLHRLHKNWSGEKIFNEARKWVIATQQHIITNEWLNEWLGDQLPPYTGYDPSTDPQIDQFFQGAAFRFGHTLVPPAVQTRDYASNGCKKGTIVRTCNSFWQPQKLLEEIGDNNTNKMDLGMDRLIMGMAGQLSEEEDHQIVEDLRGNVFGPLEFSRRDLMAVNIQRARDHGLPDYNTIREIFHLPRVGKDDVYNPSQFPTVDNETRKRFLELYGDKTDDVDLWVGGIMETNKGPGPLFTAIIKDQFRRIRDGDRFWYKNTNNGLFTTQEIERIEALRFRDILLSVTNIKPEDIQKNPFRVGLSDDDRVLMQACTDVQTASCQSTNSTETRACWHTSANMAKVMAMPCTQPGTYDYFKSSEVSFILTFLGIGALLIGLMVTLVLMMRARQKQSSQKSTNFSTKMKKSMKKKDSEKDVMETHTANEWIGRNKPERPVLIMMSVKNKKIQVLSHTGQLIRALDLTHTPLTKVFVTTDRDYLMIRVEHNYDLVLRFTSDYLREHFLKNFEEFGAAIDIKRENITTFTAKTMLKHAVTQKQRQEKLDKFFRVVFAQGFGIEHSKEEMLNMDSRVARDVIYTELTVTEFAEALSMSPEAEFVKKMFSLVDKDKNGFISFREFVDLSVIFFNGTPEQTIRLMFDMYDINATGSLTREDFAAMLRSFMETVKADLKTDDLNLAIREMMNAAGMANKQSIDFEDFQRLLGDYKDKLSLELTLPGAQPGQQTFASKAQRVVESLYGDPREIQSRIQGAAPPEQQQTNIDKHAEILVHRKNMRTYWYPFTKYIADKQLEIFWLFLYTSVLISIFAERAYYYHVEREHSGLRRIAGPGVTLTRGAASAMMFTYSTLLVTMCQNTITALRETSLNFYIPFDSSLEMHKYVACWALAFTIVHVLGHAVNFYHISTQPSDDLTCLFPNFFHSTHVIPNFSYWCWQTMTGVTGIALTILASVMFLFSLPIVRRRLYNWFWFAHSMYPLFFILMILHGTGRLIQEPFTHLFLSGPVILFTLDKIITATRRTVEIQVVKADCLPSNVTYLEFKKPSNFQYKSGQWVRISCPDLNRNEYHPFTLSSSPNEPNLTVHIRAVGPWTSAIRNRIDPTLSTDPSLPKIRVDGPYGEGAQDWYKYDVGILIGGGIGVTPFASILKDIVYKSNVNQSLGCKKIYFLWVTRTQRQFEWMVDILRELEAADEKMCVSAHIFITQFYQKFDLRTVLLYICERYFQKVSNKSLFTGLTAVTHFGRPHFLQFFRAIRDLNSNTSRVGVFSCGARSMVRMVDQACNTLNQETASETLFKHQYKSF